MRLEQDTKLDYSDVLLRPKRSTLGSRKEVRVHRRFEFRNSKHNYEGIPIMAANMDGVGTFKMADNLAEQDIFTCLVKTYSINELVSFFDTDNQKRTNYIAMSIGITDKDRQKFCDVYEQVDSKAGRLLSLSTSAENRKRWQCCNATNHWDMKQQHHAQNSFW